MKKITLTLSHEEALIVRDALVNAYIALRTGANEVVMSEEKFLSLDISDNKRNRYNTLRDYAEVLKQFCQ